MSPRPVPWKRVVAPAVLLVWGTLLCFVPLLNLLAFEVAFFTTLPVALIAGHRGARAPMEASLRAQLAHLGVTLAIVWLPVLPLTLNMLRVRNCNYLEGLAFYAILPGLTALIAHLWGTACCRVSARWPYRLFLAVLLASVLRGLAQFWFTPAVDVFDPFLGYFPGSLYDEVIPLTGRLCGARGADLAYAVGALALVLGGRSAGRRRLAGLGLTATLWTGAWLGSDTLLLHRDAARVQAELGGLTETEHYRIHHPANLTARHVALLGLDLEFRFQELSAFFGKAPAEPIDVWFYESTAQKKTLMGAGQVRIAKPWQRAVHLQVPEMGDGILAHELAHAFSAEISASPHHLSLTGLGLPNMGLIEGTAVAAAWDDAPLDAHQWSNAMERLQIAAPLETLLSPTGFLSANSRAAYTQCGSFVRFLRDTEGPSSVEALYRQGQLADDAPEFAAWRQFLAARPVDDAALAIARVRFDRPALFGRVCAHEVAALRDRVDQLRGSDPEGALRTLDELLSHVPDDPDAQLTRVALLYRLGAANALDTALSLAGSLAETPGLGLVRQARAREWQADLRFRRARPEDRDAVRATYADLLAQSFDRSWTRRIAVKRLAVDGGAWGEAVLRLLTRPEDGDASAADAAVAEAYRLGPERPVTRYLVGRLAARRGDCDQAILHSTAALAGGLPHPALTLEAARLIAACHFDAGAYAAAAADFEALSKRADLALQAGEADGLAVWGRRARFFQVHAGGLPPRSPAVETTGAN